MGDCHRFPLAELACFQWQWVAEIGWLSPFFASSDFHHGLLGALFDIKIVSPRDVAYASGVPCWASEPNISVDLQVGGTH